MPFKASILTLYPDMFPGHLGLALAGRALERGDWSIEAVQIRDFAEDKHRSVDDTPSGGGAGMVLRPDVLARAIDSIADDGRPRLLMSPRGRPLTQERVRELAAGERSEIVCGRFEGVDQRVLDRHQVEEISLGDFVLTGGEIAAQAILDATVRLIPGVLGNAASTDEESFSDGLLEHPHYTRPAIWEGQEIPAVLQSGNHAEIARWRRQKSEDLTRERRPDMWDKRKP